MTARAVNELNSRGGFLGVLDRALQPRLRTQQQRARQTKAGAAGVPAVPDQAALIALQKQVAACQAREAAYQAENERLRAQLAAAGHVGAAGSLGAGAAGPSGAAAPPAAAGAAGAGAGTKRQADLGSGGATTAERPQQRRKLGQPEDEQPAQQPAAQEAAQEEAAEAAQPAAQEATQEQPAQQLPLAQQAPEEQAEADQVQQL
eukprot:XP_001701783.1 predicted protein [Chlamydomonas reinhardtii]